MTRLALFIGRTVRLAVLALGSYGANAAFAADAVLLTSTVPGYAPGMVVASSEKLNLPEGTSATLLFQSGEILRLRGPFDGVVNQSQRQGSIAALVDAFRMQGVDATVIGGTRATTVGRFRSAMDDVHVDLQRSGTYCMQPSTSIWLTRPGHDDSRYGLRRGGMVRMLSWPAGAERIEWPANVPIEDGDKYDIITDGSGGRTITFRMMEAASASQSAWIADGVLRGCQEQFGEALKQLAHAVVRPELWLTTGRGRQPVYHPGEPIPLTIKSDSDGYLYCVSQRDNGTVVPIFPAGAVDGAQVRGATSLSLPGPRGHAALRAGSPGMEQIRCWLTDRDVSPELPHALLNTSMTPLPEHLAADVEAIFAGIGNSQIARSALRIKVE